MRLYGEASFDGEQNEERHEDEDFYHNGGVIFGANTCAFGDPDEGLGVGEVHVEEVAAGIGGKGRGVRTENDFQRRVLPKNKTIRDDDREKNEYEEVPGES